MMRIFTVYAYDVEDEGYGLHLDINSDVTPDVAKTVAKEISELLSKIPDDEFPKEDETGNWIPSEL